jgi:hypothetical protein
MRNGSMTTVSAFAGLAAINSMPIAQRFNAGIWSGEKAA